MSKMLDAFRMPPHPNTAERTQVHTRRALAAVVVGGLLLWATAAGAQNGGNTEEKAYLATRIVVDTKQGEVECYGRKPATVQQNNTVSGAVLHNTSLIEDGRSFAVPDLGPIVDAVLAINGITNARAVPAGATVTVPQFCAFVPHN